MVEQKINGLPMDIPQARKVFKDYIQTRCRACNSWPGEVCESQNTWVHSVRLADHSGKVPNSIRDLARTRAPKGRSS